MSIMVLPLMLIYRGLSIVEVIISMLVSLPCRFCRIPGIQTVRLCLSQRCLKLYIASFMSDVSSFTPKPGSAPTKSMKFQKYLSCPSTSEPARSLTSVASSFSYLSSFPDSSGSPLSFSFNLAFSFLRSYSSLFSSCSCDNLIKFSSSAFFYCSSSFQNSSSASSVDLASMHPLCLSVEKFSLQQAAMATTYML